MADMMQFPKRWEDFLHNYEFEDARRIYTNGSRLIPSFRVKQMMEHYAPVRHCEWALVEKGPDRDIYRCPWCGRTIDTIFVESEVAKQFPYCHCGTKMDRGDD